MTVVRVLEFSGADGTSHTTHYPLDGRSLLLFITAQAWLQPISFGH